MFDNQEFGYWEVPILRPLKYNYSTSDERLELLYAEKKLSSTKGITVELAQEALRTIDQTALFKNTVDFRKKVLKALQGLPAWKDMKATQRNAVINAVYEGIG